MYESTCFGCVSTWAAYRAGPTPGCWPGRWAVSQRQTQPRGGDKVLLGILVVL